MKELDMLLDEAVEMYRQADERLKRIKKEHTELKEEIKVLMKRGNVTSYKDIELKTQQRTKVNEDKLIRTLIALRREDLLVETFEVDTKKVEDAIYKGSIQAEVMLDCIETSEVQMLSFKKVSRHEK